MSKTFHLPLLATLPALLAACGDNDLDLDRYKRTKYTSYEQCRLANQDVIRQGLRNPCQKTSGGFYGPYILLGSGLTRYVGYTSSGGVAPTGLTHDSKRGTYGSFKAPVSRGGFTSTGRAGSSSSGSFGG
ncbi:hypothetical protein DAETH_22820 [Deinococcus aetherius]|uniref:Lipoprotein n=1 Tax=Deinococcus aetherius TaxID=200252 RepID=A0ABN6RG50_9DEIO|nr:hypothetical protein [Deinococcus aetherius]BDP42313.1 hypothetical protein DAETH_22820 [Deinococcus aetherius]